MKWGGLQWLPVLLVLIADAAIVATWLRWTSPRFRQLQTYPLINVLTLVFSVDLVVLVTWGALRDERVEWWAAWGQWIGGVGSVAAAVTAIWIAQRGWTLARAERGRETASRFSLWVSDGRDGFPEAKFINATGLPVYNVEVDARGNGLVGHYTTHLGVLPPTPEARKLQSMTRILREQVNLTLEMEFGTKAWQDDRGALTLDARFRAQAIVREVLRVTVTFRLGSERWRIRPDGQLENIFEGTRSG